MSRSILCLVSILLLSCAPRYSSSALGLYDEFRPRGVPRGAATEVRLARPAHVAVIGIQAPNSAHPEMPILFYAKYPRFETDRTHFPAGRHRVQPRPRYHEQRRRCEPAETPTLAGCRRAPDQLPGVFQVIDPAWAYSVGGTDAYLVLTSEEFIDPFTLAEELYYATLASPEATDLLRRGVAGAAGAELETMLLDRRGSFAWAGLYVAVR